MAHADGVPFVASRRPSDLAGRREGADETGTVLSFAAVNAATVGRAFLAEME